MFLITVTCKNAEFLNNWNNQLEPLLSFASFLFSVLPRHTIFYDIVDFLFTRVMTPRLRQEVPLLVTRPFTQDIQVQHIRAISQLR